MTKDSTDQIKKAVMDYFGSASICFPEATENLIEAEFASDDELIEIATSIGIAWEEL